MMLSFNVDLELLSYILLLVGATVAITGIVQGQKRKLGILVTIYSLLLIIIGVLGVLAGGSGLFLFLSVVTIVSGILLLAASFAKSPILLGLGYTILNISPTFFTLIVGGLIAIGAYGYMILAVIIAFIALSIYKKILSEIVSVGRKILSEIA